jgi:serine/threonine protein kinase
MSYMQGIQDNSGPAQPDYFIGRVLRGGEYRIDALLGHGGMGRVFLATHIALQIPVAIKQGLADKAIPDVVMVELDRLLHSENAQRKGRPSWPSAFDFPLSGGEHTDRFLREALLLAHLQHASLPAIYDYFIEEGYCNLVMDYIPGPTLSEYIQKHAPLAPLEALNYAIQLCDVLEYLHKQSPPVIYRDLKPSNIILSPDGRVMLVDFGIARHFKAGQQSDTTDLGSPGYAPPEQYRGEGQTDGRSDLYSLGVILHEMLSGQRPSATAEKPKSLHALNPGISVALSGLVHVATRAEPIYRFQSAHTLYLALERAYSIEERRAYQRRIAAAETHEPSQWASLQILASAEEGRGAWQPTVQLSQRRQVREALQEAHRERIEQERAEEHLPSIDESLHHRSSMGVTPLPSPAAVSAEPGVPGAEEEPLALRSSRSRHRLPRVLFAVALLAFAIMASINLYGFFFHPRGPARPVSLQGKPAPRPTAEATLSVAANDAGIWQVLPSMPSPEADNTSVYLQIQGKGYIYMTGGFRGSRSTPRYDQNLYRYDIAGARWEILANTAIPGMVNNAVALDQQKHLYFTAGYSSSVYAITSLLYMYDPLNGKLQKIVPPPAVSLGYSAAVLADQQGHLYISQGFLQAGDPHTRAGTGWYRYDINTGGWHVLKPLPLGAGYVMLATDGVGNIFMLGGARDAGQDMPIRRIYRYDIARDSWSVEQTSVPGLLSGASSCLNTQRQLVIVGGYDAQHKRPLGQAWLLNLPGLRWTPLAALPAGGSVLGSAACDGAGHVYLARGANDPSKPTRDFWQLTLPASD